MDFYAQFSMSKFASLDDREEAIVKSWETLQAIVQEQAADIERLRTELMFGQQCFEIDGSIVEKATNAAKVSFNRHRSSVKGQQVTEADGFDAHLVWATQAYMNVKLTDSQHKVKVLTDALESWKGIAENCSIEAGYCCCGEDMKTHSHPMSCGHSPVDMADEPVSRAMELTYKALATVKGE